ncbi:MAG: PAS domain S-box protein [Pseudomonadota bacterium]|nr:PAS domain S-box protein [Pseudomonadota bacterium]
MILLLDRVRAFQWAVLVVALAGLIVAAIGAWCIASWHEWVSPPAFELLQYDAAWAFFFGGVALTAHALGLFAIGRWSAAVPVVLGAIRLAAYGAPGWIDVHPIAANQWLPYGAGNYNDMGVLTAAVFVVLGCAVAALGPRVYGPVRSVFVTLLAAIALALAAVLLVAAWTGGVVASQWLLLTGGERIGALLFVLLSGGVLAGALVRGEDEQRAVRRWTPGIVWFAVFVCVLVLWQALRVQEARYVDNSTHLVATDIKNRIERTLGVTIRQLERLAERVVIYGFSEDRWQRDASTLLNEPLALEGIAWAGDDLTIGSVVPQSQASAIGSSLRSDPDPARAIDAAIRSRRATLSRFVDLRLAGGKGFVIYVPAYADGSLRGIVAGSLGGDWLSSLLGDRFTDYQIALLDGGELANGVGASESGAGPERTQEQAVNVANARWTLRVTPTREYLRRTNVAVPEAALGLGAVLATLLGLCTYLFQTARRRARDLAATNTRLLEDIQARRQVEQALRDQERRTRLIIDAIRDYAIYMLDREGNIASWNPGAEALNGYSAQEIIGRHFSILYPPDRQAPPEAELAIAARQGRFEEECWHLRKDGTRYCGDDIISAIRDDNGAVQGFSIITRDATPRIALREQTERSRDFYFALFSGFPNLVWRSDAQGSCDYLNQAWLDYTGRSREAELGSGWLQGMHADDRARWRSTFDQAYGAMQPFEIEFRLRRANGEYGSMICVGRPYHDMQGQFAGYLCSCYDNSTRRAMEIALRESEARYEGMTANVPGMVFELLRDSTGHLSFSYVSQGCEALTGLPESQLTADADSFFRLIPAPERTHLSATLDASAAQLTTWNWAGRLLPPHGASEKWINIRARPRRLDSGEVIWDGLVFDDTQGRLAQLEIERSREELRALSRHLQTIREEEKARIAREVHDELGSTLTALKMDLDWLGEHMQNSPKPVAQKRAAMGKLVEAAVAATRRIVTDLRPSILDDLGLSAALRWQAAEFAKHTGARVDVDAPETDHHIDRDVALALFRIFQETLTNIARHAKATAVTVKLLLGEDALVLQIRDNGIGISNDDLRKPTSLGIRGMRERARQLGGEVSVSAQAGSGTTVVISIPAKNRAG